MTIDRYALRLAAIYLAFGLGWILFSDRIMLALAPDLAIFSEISLWKGVVFVVISAFGLYLAAQRPRPAPAAANDGTGVSTRQLVIVFAVLAGAILLGGLGWVASTANAQKDKEVERLKAIARSKVGEIGTWLEERRADARISGADATLAALARRLQAGDETARAPLAARLEIHREAAAYAAASLVDAAGNTLLAVGEAPPDVAAPTRAAASKALAEGHTLATDLYPLADTEGAAIDFVAPLAASQPPLAVVLQAEPRRTLFSLIRHWPVPSASAEIELLRKDGDAITVLNELRHKPDAALTLRVPLADERRLAVQGLGGAATPGRTLEGIDYRGVPVLGVIETVSDTGWFVIAKLDKDELYAQARRDSAWIAAVDTLALLIAAAIVLMLHQRRELRHAAEQRQAAMVFESTRDGVLITDLDERIVAVNRAFTEITGFTRDEVLGQTPRILRSNRQTPDFYQTMWSALLKTGSWQGEIWNRRKNGEVFPQWMSVSRVTDAEECPTHYVAVFTDISQAKRSEAELEHLAHYDPLTDLPNRRLIQLRLEHAIERARRHGHRAGVLYLDLDRFKTVNDSLGHAVGDFLLTAVAGELNERVRGDDTLGRLGGDEFLVVIDRLDELEDAAVVARDLLAVLGKPFLLPNGQEVYLTGSIGISVFPDDGKNSMELLRDADAAMYRAKENGRNQFCFYTGDMNADAHDRLALEAALWRALEREELLLHYQPKVDLASGRIRGAEALLRWRRGSGEMVPPGEFIPLAEKSGLIGRIGNWVIDTACRQLRIWIDQGMHDARVAVNVSARQFLAGDLEAVVSEALQRHGVVPRHLELELTESMLVERPEQAAALLHQLKVLGVELSLDDFGTGYSSFAYLSRFPIDALKIDQSFVRNLETQEDAATITDAIIGLAHRMALRVVAEGVETEAQLAYLRERGCDEIQGYYFSRPLPAEAFAELVNAGRSLPPARAGASVEPPAADTA